MFLAALIPGLAILFSILITNLIMNRLYHYEGDAMMTAGEWFGNLGRPVKSGWYACIVILASILNPLADNIGMNEIQFCIVMITALGVGFIAPTLGLNRFGVSGTTGERLLKNSSPRRALRPLYVRCRVADGLCASDLHDAAARNLQVGSSKI